MLILNQAKKEMNTDQIIKGGLFIIGNIALSVTLCTYIIYLVYKSQLFRNIKDEYEPIKNALLTYALVTVYRDLIETGNYNYNEYDGHQLPSLSGADAINALMSYIYKSDNPHMQSKYNAIQRFLSNYLRTSMDQEAFLETFIILTSKESEDEQQEEQQTVAIESKPKEE
jgi:hypothetical protein